MTKTYCRRNMGKYKSRCASDTVFYSHFNSNSLRIVSFEKGKIEELRTYISKAQRRAAKVPKRSGWRVVQSEAKALENGEWFGEMNVGK